jgi:hypothetical protein
VKQSHLGRKIAYGVGAVVLVLVAVISVFYFIFLNKYINKTVPTQLSAAVRKATNGKYDLKLKSLTRSGDSLLCVGVDLYRLRYDSLDNGLVPRELSIDTASFKNISWWKLLLGKGLYISEFAIRSPKLYMVDAGDHEDVPKPSNKAPDSLPKSVPVVAIDHIVMSQLELYMPYAKPKDQASLTDVTLSLTEFRIDDESLKKPQLFFARSTEFDLPKATYKLADGFYSLEIEKLHGSASDSTLTIGAFAFRPNYSEEEFAAKNPYIRGRADFRCSNIAINGLNFARMFTASGVHFRSMIAKRWSVDFFSDRRRPANPHPPVATMPNDMISSLKFPIVFDTLELLDGKAVARQREPGSVKPGVLFFANTALHVRHFSTDTASRDYKQNTNFRVNTMFLGVSPVVLTATYPLTSKSFDMSIQGKVGGFDGTLLNAWLNPIERSEISQGALDHGDVRMEIRDGVSKTTVTPIYHDVKMKFIATDPKTNPGFFAKALNGVKSFLANALVIRSANSDANGEKPKIGITVRKRPKTEEYFQFLWFSLRKALGAVIGGFS